MDALSWLEGGRFVVETRPHDLAIALPDLARDSHHWADAFAQCGAALCTAWIVLRALGIEPSVSFPHDPDRPDIVATLGTAGAKPSTTRDWNRYLALCRIRTWPPDTITTPVSPGALASLAARICWPRTTVLPARSEWSVALRQLGCGTFGLCVLLVLTEEDTRDDWVLAGAAVHDLRIEASTSGIAADVVTPVTLRPGMRARLLAALDLPGVPQAVVRVGSATPAEGAP
ncbi:MULTISPECIES: hypothetical protein [unclassified Amycolatopsis]|uniref:hypothetical protein n=1 Tax=unclassified Amycolatopsis TaxID=2618356 RepID=UPI001C6A1A01|nr:hypothetical protein [Amycolatopsis sp. DSM 110486]QYN20277.1 hypothetical protein K1T34_48430 [Amycolatopsis sp. DSM 110486]